MWDDVQEETPAQPAATEPAPAAADGAPDATAAAGDKPEEADTPAPTNVTLGTDPGRLVFKHWIRPRFNQYNYIYDYQHSYYDDLIRYMDRRNQGLPTERPRAQTWGERALRTYLANAPTTYYARTANRDTKLLHHISMGARFQRYHSKALISRKYSKLGFNTVYI